jgi:hypothetical protein
MNIIKSLVLVLAMSTSFTAKAQSFDWGSLLGNLNGGDVGGGDLGGQLGDIGSIGDLLGGGGDSDALMGMAFDAAYMYASHSEYAPILVALNINSGDDLQAFLMNDEQNFNDIIAHLALDYASENPEFSQWFSQVGVKDHASLVKFMKKTKHKSTINKMALKQARGDEDYSQWLSQLGINDASDIQELLNGSGDNGDLFAKIWPLVEQYVETNHSEYAQFLPMLQQLLGIGEDPVIDLPVEEDDGTVEEEETVEEDEVVEEDDEIVPPEVVGAFRGLPLSEVKEIQKARAPAKKKPAFNLFSLFK